MSKFYLSLHRETIQADKALEMPALFGALWRVRGTPKVEDTPCQTPGSAQFLRASRKVRAIGGPASWLRFSLSKTAPEPDGLLHVEQVEIAPEQVLLRLDTVTFPPGANAWRHVHPGPGIRYLLQGELELQADDHRATMRTGDCWFEAADSPVKATASDTHGKSGFVRFMVLPVALQGQPSIRILDAADAAKPRMQVTHRHIDQVVRLPQG
ncbi:cupin domain-containing protein [Aliiruegeria sabulilitoris]|uniref:cupin domain-containing protein n=1 Tax=Aliiruegeria sabulilitoris TaxID=1510458 RepID=UPI00082C1349|nr:cupin domain-containing protein [Aliiruegeria sabulilitoris]NDR59300.1 cupin domain-containing protein [Pseudoruegeria sp. M32A2M]